MMEQLMKFGDQEFPVRTDKDGKVCMTDLWKLAGSSEGKRPVDWTRQKQSIGFIDAASVFLKGASGALLKTTKGKNGATWAHPIVALQYAKFLSDELGVIVNQNFLERIEEEKNPDLIADRYIRTWKKKGKDDEWISDRFKGLSIRKQLTAVLKNHGVVNNGYRNVTNGVYQHLYGGSSAVVREKKGIDEKANIRDNVSRIELRAIELAEMLTIENIENNNLLGNAQCEMAALKASKAVASAIVQNRAPN